MSEWVTIIKKMPAKVSKMKIPTLVYKFDQANETTCQVDINVVDCETAMLKGASSDIEKAWKTLVEAASSVAVADSGNEPPARAIAEWMLRPGSDYLRPMQAIRGDAIGRFDDGRIYLIGPGALLVEAIDHMVRQFGRREAAVSFFAEPIWHGAELQKFGYPENSLDLCRIDHFSHGADHYWQNAACDNIWKSLAGKSIDKFQTYTALGTCCRNERRQQYFLERLKVFRMREVAAVGSPPDILAFRERALTFVQELNYTLQLNARLETASDPFFIQDGASMDSVLTKYDVPDLIKIEYRPEIYDGKSLACASFNVHGDFFAKNMGYGGAQSWTSCAAFGLERLAWAVLIQHGNSFAQWPATVKTAIEEIHIEKQG